MLGFALLLNSLTFSDSRISFSPSLIAAVMWICERDEERDGYLLYETHTVKENPHWYQRNRLDDLRSDDRRSQGQRVLDLVSPSNRTRRNRHHRRHLARPHVNPRIRHRMSHPSHRARLSGISHA